MIMEICFFVFFISGCGKNPLAPSPSPSPTAQLPEITEEPSPTETPTPEPVLLGKATTKLLDKSEGRLKNINLAVKAVNGYLLKPGAVFSFNGVVGKRTPERGYQDATVLVKGEKKQDCGGGVCQVSTTIYQAANRAGLTILERHNHGKDVGYAPQGSDAAVNYGSLDMRFKNNTDRNVKIHVTVETNQISVMVYQLTE